MRVLAVVDPPNREGHQSYSTHDKVLLMTALIAELVDQVERGFRVAFGVAHNGGHGHGGVQVVGKSCNLCQSYLLGCVVTVEPFQAHHGVG